jgi:cobalt-zinc-cadmium efflux system outer membrane protein
VQSGGQAMRTASPAVLLPESRLARAVLGIMLSFLAGPGISPAAAETDATASAPANVRSAALLGNSQALIDWIRAHHPEVLAAQAGVESAQAQRRVSRLLQNPSLNVAVNGLSVGRVHEPAHDYGDPINWSAGLQQTFEIGKRGPRGAAADLRAEEARATHGDLLAQKVADARDALARVVYLNARQSILEERVVAARQVVELEGVRLQHGDISGTDHDRLRLEAASVERDAADNHAALAVALADCAIAVAAPCSAEGSAINDLDGAAELPTKLPDAAQSAAKQPAVRALDLEHDASMQDARFWHHRAIPDPTVGIAYTRDYYVASDAQPHTLGVFASIPLPFFDGGGAQADSSTAAAMQAQEQARALEAQFRAGASGLATRKESLERKLHLLDSDLLPLSSSIVKSAEVAYHSGQLSLTDYLIVRRDYSALLLDQTDTRFELFQVRNELRRMLGLDASLAAR